MDKSLGKSASPQADGASTDVPPPAPSAELAMPTSIDSESWDLDLEAGRTELHYWRDLWRYRELFYFLAWRDILVRYKQTVVGVAWALIQPVLTMLVLVLVFGRLARLSSGGVPYPLFVFAALLPWQFFSRAVTEAGTSLITNSNLVSKVYFPRLIVPAASVITAVIDLFIAGGFLIALMVWYQLVPDWRILTLPLFVLLVLAAALGAGLWIAALNVTYRDFRYVVPFVVLLGTYLSPVGFSTAIVPEEWRFLYSLNPLVGIIEGFRWSLLRGNAALAPSALVSSVALVTTLLLSGAWYFRATEKRFADVI